MEGKLGKSDNRKEGLKKKKKRGTKKMEGSDATQSKTEKVSIGFRKGRDITMARIVSLG